MNSMTRRQLLTSATALTASSLAMPTAFAATDPIRRNGPASLRLSLAAYSYRDYLQAKKDPHMDLIEFVERCAKLPLAAVELTEYYFPKPITSEFLMKLKRHCYVNGLDISGSPMGNVFTHPAGEARDKEIARVREWVDHCAALGVPAIRVFAGSLGKGQSMEDAKKFTVECLEIACQYASSKGVLLALENHGGIVAEANDILDIVKAVKSEWLGINLDTGNFRTEDPYGDIAKCAPYAVTVQVKSEIQVKGQAKKPADLAREMKILKDAGYRGYVTLEYEAAEEPLVAVPKILDEMARLL